jgi:IS30 family transposase
MAEHVRFTIDTGVQVYFCDPHSPWQRGSNENTNGLLREFLPRTRDLSTVTADELRKIENLLNGRPRKTLGWMTPSEKFAQIVAMTA